MNDDLLAALVTTPLTPFEGRDVLRAAIEIPGAAGGLREAMKFEPLEMHTGQEMYVLLKTKVGKIRFDPIKDTEAFARVHVLNASEATFVEAAFAEEHLTEQRDRIRVLREKAAGVAGLDDPVDGIAAAKRAAEAATNGGEPEGAKPKAKRGRPKGSAAAE